MESVYVRRYDLQFELKIFVGFYLIVSHFRGKYLFQRDFLKDKLLDLRKLFVKFASKLCVGTRLEIIQTENKGERGEVQPSFITRSN